MPCTRAISLLVAIFVGNEKGHNKDTTKGCILKAFRLQRPLKGAGSHKRKQTCYLYYHCCPHVAIVFCADSGRWGESTLKLPLKFHQYLCNHVPYEFVVCFPTKDKSSSSNNTFMLRKIVENLCDMAYKKYCKIVVSKEVCLHYVTLPL